MSDTSRQNRLFPDSNGQRENLGEKCLLPRTFEPASWFRHAVELGLDSDGKGRARSRLASHCPHGPCGLAGRRPTRRRKEHGSRILPENFDQSRVVGRFRETPVPRISTVETIDAGVGVFGPSTEDAA